MRLHMLLAVIIALTVINVGVVLVNTTASVRADVAGMSYRELRKDRDFRKAVRYVVESECYIYDSNIGC